MTYRDSHLGAETAESYDRLFRREGTREWCIWQIERHLMQHIMPQHLTGKCIDFASGTGRVAGLLSELGFSVIGIDVSTEMLDVARHRFPDVEFVAGDVTTDPGISSSERFNGVQAITCFRFFLNAEPTLRAQVLEWMRATLSPAGCLVVGAHHNPRSLNGLYVRFRRRHWASAPEELTILAMKGVLAQHGFAVVKVHFYGFSLFTGREVRFPRARIVFEHAAARLLRNVPFGSHFIVIAQPISAS